MTRIAPIVPQEADAKTAAALSAVRRKLGMLPNVVTTIARSPAALDGYLKLGQSLASGRLTARQRELIAIAVAEENACAYCLRAHAAIGKGAGLDPEDFERARRGEALAPAEQATTAFALEVVRTGGEVGEAAFVSARRAGVDDGLMIEVVAHVALNVLTNYVNRLAGTEVDFPPLPLRRAA